MKMVDSKTEIAEHEDVSEQGSTSRNGENAQRTDSIRSMNTQEFLAYRQRSSIRFGIPSNFFQSRAEIRTWGEQDLTDPSIQPYDENDPNLPKPFHESLPGYRPSLCKHVLSKKKVESRDPLMGPEITIFPPVWIPHWTPDPNFKPQKYGYNWEDSLSFRMDRLPYVNADFEPVSAEITKMYSQNYPFAAYPYGVPRV